jgi:putative membrane protein
MKTYINCLMIIIAAAGTASSQTQRQNPLTAITAEQFINQAALSGMKEVTAGKMAMQKAQDTKLKDYGAMMTQDHEKANAELTAIAKSKNIALPGQNDTSTVSTGSGSIGKKPAPDGTQTGITSTSGTTVNANTTGSTTGTAKVTTGISETDTVSGTKETTAYGNTKLQQAEQPTGNPVKPDTGTSLKMITEAEITSALKELYALNGKQFDIAYTQMMVEDHKNAVALFQQGVLSADPDLKAYAGKYLPILRNHLQQIQKISGTSKSRQ